METKAFTRDGVVPPGIKNKNRMDRSSIHADYRSKFDDVPSFTKEEKWEKLLWTMDYSRYNGDFHDTVDAEQGRPGSMNRKHKRYGHSPLAYIVSSLDLKEPLAWLCRQAVRDGPGGERGVGGCGGSPGLGLRGPGHGPVRVSAWRAAEPLSSPHPLTRHTRGGRASDVTAKGGTRVASAVTARAGSVSGWVHASRPR